MIRRLCCKVTHCSQCWCHSGCSCSLSKPPSSSRGSSQTSEQFHMFRFAVWLELPSWLGAARRCLAAGGETLQASSNLSRSHCSEDQCSCCSKASTWPRFKRGLRRKAVNVETMQIGRLDEKTSQVLAVCLIAEVPLLCCVNNPLV